MYKFLTKNGQTLAFGLGILLTVLTLIILFSGLGEFESLSDEQKAQTGIFNFGLQASIALVILGFIAMVGFGLYQVATNIKGSLKGIIGFVLLIVIFLVARGIGSDDSAIAGTIETFKVTDGQSSLITGAITSAIVLAALAALTFVGSEVRNFFK